MRSRRVVKQQPQPPQQPKPLPSNEEMEQAWKVVDTWFLHYYQLLFFQNPKLTEPGDNGRPFNLKMSAKHGHCIHVECQPWSGRREEFDFHITPFGGDSDEDILKKCRLILEAIETKKEKVNSMACCSLAVYKNCVCAYAFDCPIHGEQHIGSHD